MPATPLLNDKVRIYDGDDFSINSLTIGRNGNTIENVADDLIINIKNAKVEFVYDGTTWQVFSDIGKSGYTGSQGVIGYTGSKGDIGYTGSAGGEGSIGEVAFFALNTPPAGWLKANGAAISRSTYSALFAAIGTTYGSGNGSTTFNLPDLRGEFLRGWDDGRGIDSGRGFASLQSHDIQSHTHGALAPINDVNNPASQGYPANDVHRGFRTTDRLGSTRTGLVQNTGGNETRPRNVALLACIKY